MKRSAVGWVLLLAVACRTPPLALPLPSDDPRPVALVNAWAEQALLRRGMRGRARLVVDSEDGAIALRAKHVIAVERPSQLRVEVRGILGQSIAVLVTDGEHFELFRAAERFYESGDVHPGLLWAVAGIALSTEEAVAVLLGVPISDSSWRPGRAMHSEDGVIRVDLVDSEGVTRQRASFDSAGRLRGCEAMDRTGAVEWRARFADYRDVAGSPFAHAITLDVSEGKTHAEISMRDVELNPQLSPDVFRLNPPRYDAENQD